VNWNTALDNSGTTLEGDYQFRVPSTSTFIGKYVQITVSGCSNGGGYASIYEIKINGIPLSLLNSFAPTITSALTASGSPGSPFDYQIIAGNGPTSYGATGLPTGLNINSSTGEISGTTAQTGSFPVTITATNSDGTTSVTLTLTLDVNAPSTDTPTMPQWMLGFLALLLLFFAGRSLEAIRKTGS